MKIKSSKKRMGNRYIPPEEFLENYQLRNLDIQPLLEKISNNKLFTFHDGVIYFKHHR